MATFANPPFEPAWWSFELGKYRPCDGTYERYSYESLPPLADPDESLEWLTPLSERVDNIMDIYRNDPEERGKVDVIAAAARAHGFTLPPSFVTLMSAPKLQDTIPSNTACYFKLGATLEPCPGKPDASITPFLYDQQDCVVWYLYLAPNDVSCVVAFPGELEEYLEAVKNPETKWTIEAVAEGFSAAAPSFASFIYRWWLENTIWFKLNSSDEKPLTPAEQAYLDYYAQQTATN